jgi:hypothetical protein
MPVVHRIRMNSVNRLRCVLGNCIRCDELPKLATLHHGMEETPPNVDMLGSRLVVYSIYFLSFKIEMIGFTMDSASTLSLTLSI